MRKNILITFMMIPLLSLTSCIGAGSISDVSAPPQKNMLPTLEGKNLHGDIKIVPYGLEGKQKLLLIAFEQDQQYDINTWLGAAKDIEAKNSDFRYYEIPLIYEASIPTRFWANNGMRSGITDTTARARTITVYTDREQFMKFTDMKLDRIYAVLLNEKNEIIWQADGPATEKGLQSLKEKITK